METEILENDPVAHAEAVSRWDTPEAVAARAAARRAAVPFKPRLLQKVPPQAADIDERTAF